jgi:FkbM family methyltransferase
MILIGKKIYSTDSKEHIKTLDRWYKDKGDSNLRLNYNLNEESLVFDLGGFQGQWASDLFAKYSCKIHLFEPHLEYATEIQKRFVTNPKISVHAFGLASKTEQVEISIAGEASSTINKKNLKTTPIQLKDAMGFLNEYKISKIDLMKINIEGGEYDLLEYLIANGFITKIKNIQIQFHWFVPNAEEKLNSLYQKLQKTHRLTYHYKFVWESWELI